MLLVPPGSGQLSILTFIFQLITTDTFRGNGDFKCERRPLPAAANFSACCLAPGLIHQTNWPRNCEKFNDNLPANLLHAQDLQKRAYDKGAKPWNYALGKKVCLNSKYINTKQNKKLETKFFGPF